MIFTGAAKLLAQVTPDFQRPFYQGCVVDLPGTTEYLGDLPQDVKLVSDSPTFNTMEGLISQRVGWFPGTKGFNAGTPGVLFEGIPYPFLSSEILNWMPAFRNFELLDFPAAAWWGPSAASGAVQIRLPESHEASMDALEAWGGSGGLGGGEGRFDNPFFSLSGNFQHGFLNESATMDTYNLLSGIRWIKEKSFKLDSGFLAAQEIGGENWYSAFADFKWDSPNFQAFELKPFFQSAVLGQSAVREIGSDFNYHFIMAGLVESQLGFGLSRDDFSTYSPSSNGNKGYIQNFDVIDLLGDFKLNAAFRLDFSSVSDTSFSTVLGAEYRLDTLLFQGSYSKSVDPTLALDIQQGELGFRFQPEDGWSFTGRYVYEGIGDIFWNGGRAKIEWCPGQTILWAFKRINLSFEEKALVDQKGSVLFDTGGQMQWSFFGPVSLWVAGRGISGQNFYTNAGFSCALTPHAQLEASMENIGNFPVSWPDISAPEGSVVRLGAEIGF